MSRECRCAPRPCPPNRGAVCWLKGYEECAACIPSFALEAYAALMPELIRHLAPELAKLTARQQAIALVRQCSGATIGKATQLNHQQQRERIRHLASLGLNVTAIAAREGVHRATVYRALHACGP